MINPTFKNISSLFVLSFTNPDSDLGRDHYGNYYMSLVGLKYFNVLIDNKPFFGQPVKTNKKRMKNLSKF